MGYTVSSKIGYRHSLIIASLDKVEGLNNLALNLVNKYKPALKYSTTMYSRFSQNGHMVKGRSGQVEKYLTD